MADYHVRRSRLSSSGSGSDDFEDESLDPRIQVELEKLNKASEEINRLELELDDARASFRQTLSESTQKLDVLAKKLGSCLEKARPYYDARVKAKEAHLETQRAALRFERACSMHEAAKEMVQLAEQGYMRREQASDPAWQEMLNHATMKVNEAEKERNESEEEHQRTMIRFKVAEDQVQSLQKDLKRAITKSKPYFEMKAKFNQIMEEHKHKVSVLEEDVSSAKSLYSTALRSLEAISDEIHRQRLERRQQQQLGVRGAGVGAECPLPPPSWEKGLSIDGRDALHTGNCQGLDPLGVLKVSSTVSYGGASVSRQRSRNLSGESCHGNEIVDEESLLRAKESPAAAAVVGVSSQDDVVVVADVDAAAPKEQSPVADGNEEGQQDGGGSGSGSSSSPQDKQGVLIPGDPLGVLPPTYTSLSDTRLASPSRSSGSASISHPAFTGSLPPRSASHTSSIAHPLVSRAGASHVKASLVSRSKSATSTPEAFVPPSVVYANPEEARRLSYRCAVEASQRDAEEFELPENLDTPELDEVYMSLPCAEGRSRSVRDAVVESRQRSYSNPAQPSDLKARSPPHAIPGRISSAVQEALADGRRHSSAPERSATLTSYTQHALSEHGSQEGSPVNGSPSSARRTHRLQGLILRIDPTMDPLRDFEPRVRSQTAPPAPSQGSLSATSPPAAASQPEPHTPTPTPTPTQSAPNLPGKKAQDAEESAADSMVDCSVSKPIIRSASTISTAGSERSETEFSEVESVSATQSPTKPRSRLLHVPASGECVEDSSDTESLASTGPMLDDEQVEFLTMDFTDASISLEREDYSSAALPSHLTRNSWSRMSLPPRLSYLEGFISRAKRLSGEFDSSAPDFPESPTEEEAEEGSLSENAKGFVASERLGSSHKEGCSSQARSLPREFDASAPPDVVESPTEQDGGETSVAGDPKGLCKNRDQFRSSHNEDVARDQEKETERGEAQKDDGAETKVETLVVRL